MKRYVSNQDQSVRMFKNGFLELFSHVHPAVPAIIYFPVVAYMFYRAIVTDISLYYVLPLLLFGILVWSLTEYTLHRYVFHFMPKSTFGKQIHFMFHGVHHDYPNDSTRLVMPPIVSIPLAVLFYFVFQNILGAHYLPPFFAGFILGYLSYDLTHYAVHHFGLKGKVGLYLKQQHMRHHYMDPDGNYGVSSPLWDFVFGTYMRKPQQETVKVDR
ncbi:MAG TPA: sterol desaturase family protein [Candidatus Kryptonia bacterium]